MIDGQNKLLYHLGLFSILFMGNVILCGSVFLLLGMEIHPAVVLIAFLGSLLVLRKKVHSGKKYWFALIATWLFLFTVALAICGWIYDISWDGNAYHKAAIGDLAEGWNPIYQTLGEFALQSDIEGINRFTSLPWAEFFPKASWIFGASIYVITGNIETAKVLNVLVAFCVFAYSWEFFNQRLSCLTTKQGASAGGRKERFFTHLVFCTVCTANPITVNQLMVSYVDGLLASGITLLFLCLLNLTWKRKDFPHAEEWFWLFPTILLLCNLKFTSLGITAVFCAVFYFFWLMREWMEARAQGGKIRWEGIRAATIFYVVVVICSVLIVGASSYVRNTVVWGHPFHPIMGPNATTSESAVMADYLPEDVENKSAIEKWFLIFFSKTKCAARAETPIQLKIPFTFAADELLITTIDTERGGFGFWFSGIFLVSLAVSAIEIRAACKDKKYEKVCLLTIIHGCCLLLVSIVSASWLARYSPYLYVPVLLAQIILLHHGDKVSKTLFFILSGITLLNNITFAAYPAYQMVRSVSIHAAMGEMKESDEPVLISSDMCGPLFNLIDEEINYVVAASLPDEAKMIKNLGQLSYSIP